MKIKLTEAGEDLLVNIIGYGTVVTLALLIIGLVGYIEVGM